jgi:phosphoribosylaminoimidazole-succinocarboxamide synthase
VQSVITSTELPGVERVAQGKVRDVYAVGGDLLIVATDRISAFDCILPQGIPGKGRVLTQMSIFWFEFLKDAVPNHLIATDVSDFPAPLREFRDQLEGRSMLVKRCRMEPIECVARGYVSGSGWKDYKRTGAICGIPLRAGLRESDRLPQPLFTPASKASTGHDENISFDEAASAIGTVTAELLRSLTLRIYGAAAQHAESRGIILADTKFEFGVDGSGELVLGDEVCTPDSSRFWPADEYEAGRGQPSFDKQYVRDWAAGTGWDRNPPAPAIPDEIVARTREKYVEAYERVTGRPFSEWLERTGATA